MALAFALLAVLVAFASFAWRGKARLHATIAETEARLGNSIGDWHATFDAIRDPVLVVDRDGRVERANAAAAALLGTRFPDLIGASMLGSVAGEPLLAARRLVDDVIRGGHDRAEVVRTEHGRTWRVSVKPFRRPSALASSVVVLRDMTEVEELTRRLVARDRMAELGAFVSGVAHEVRNPLFGLTACLEAWEAEAGEERFAPYRERADREVARLNRLMHDLLEYGRPAPLERTPCELDGVLAAAASEVQYLARARGVAVTPSPNGRLPPVEVDRERFEQALVNLLENAISFSPAGGEVVLGARHSGERADAVEISVLDRGPGFSAVDLEKALEPFFSRRRGGTGLGLAIVRRVVEEHGGTVALANRDGGGARVLVTLPVDGGGPH